MTEIQKSTQKRGKNITQVFYKIGKKMEREIFALCVITFESIKI